MLEAEVVELIQEQVEQVELEVEEQVVVLLEHQELINLK